MSSVRHLQIGTTLIYDGSLYKVEGIEGHAIRLRSTSGHLLVLATRELFQAPDFEVLSDSDEQRSERTGGVVDLGSDSLGNVPALALIQAKELEAHLNEALTGHPSGQAMDVKPDSIKPSYDPHTTSLVERMESKAKELNISKSKLYESKRRYHESGLYGLIDKRRMRQHTAFEKLDPQVREALLDTITKLTNDSNMTVKRIFRLTKQRIDSLTEPVDMPSQATMYRIVSELTRGRGTMGAAKERRSIANRPQQTYRQFKAHRPGEVVLIDTTSLDVFALNPVDRKWTSLELTLALDLYTRSILAFRFTPKGAGGVDASLLLADIVYPMRMNERWNDDARWSYCGIPESIILNIFDEPNPAKRPVVRPDTVVVDHGKMYESETFRSACRALGISIQSARPYTPTDKAQIERLFRTVRESLLENLPGYKGPDIYSRGLKVEEKAFYFVSEIEDIFAEWAIRYYQNKPHEGLHVPGVPGRHVSPNEMYEFGVATTGFLCVPPDADLYYQLLQVHYRKIGHDGFTLGGLRYDGEALGSYRNLKSSRGGKNVGKYPIRLDPRDRSKVYFQDPADRSWHEIPWIDAPSNVRPFFDKLLNHAKGLLLAEGTLGVSSTRNLSDIIEEIFDRVNSDQLVNPKEREIIAKGFVKSLGVTRDRRAIQRFDEEEYEDDPSFSKEQEAPSRWQVDSSSIEAYPLLEDEARRTDDQGL